MKVATKVNDKTMIVRDSLFNLPRTLKIDALEIIPTEEFAQSTVGFFSHTAYPVFATYL